MARKVDYKTALRTLKRVIKQKGFDFKFPEDNSGCTYTNRDGSPNCIVGCALNLLEIERPSYGVHGGKSNKNGWVFSNWSPNYLGDMGRDTLESWLAENDVIFTPKASKLWALTQYYQDEGIEWGESLTRALEDLANGRE